MVNKSFHFHMVNPRQETTLIVIGETGAGKSELGNAILQRPAFIADPSPHSVTMQTSAETSVLDGIRRTVIDTQGLDDSKGVDSAHIQQMVQFLRSYQRGANAVALVMNGQADRLTVGTQKLIRLLNVHFNNPQFWYHFCVVFTKCYADRNAHKDVKRSQYRDALKKLAVECAGPSVANIPLPMFFVDSTEWQQDRETQDELALLNAFVVGLPPLPTANLVAPNPQWFKIERETKSRVLIGTRDEAISNGTRRIFTYQDQTREKRTGYDGKTITYSDWTKARQWDEQKVRMQEKVVEQKVVNESRTQLWKTEKCGGRRYGICGPRSTRQVPAGERVTKTWQETETIKTIGFDGEVNMGVPRVIRTWTT
jgi:GTPase SAR1 family protein